MCHGYSLNCFFVHLELWGFSVKEKSYVDLVIYVPRLLKLERNDLCRAIQFDLAAVLYYVHFLACKREKSVQASNEQVFCVLIILILERQKTLVIQSSIKNNYFDQNSTKSYGALLLTMSYSLSSLKSCYESSFFKNIVILEKLAEMIIFSY